MSADTSSAPDALAPPAGNPRFPALDGLRGVAALLVVIFHADVFAGAEHTALGRVFSHGGDVGVCTFFLITGFLLYRPFYAGAVGNAPAQRTGLFYWRRVLRIIPAYWVALVVLSYFIHWGHQPWAADVFFLQVYRAGWARTGIAPAWSVCVEMSFYLALPVFALLLRPTGSRLEMRRRQLLILLILALLSIGFRVLITRGSQPVHDYWNDVLPGTMLWFCAGMLLAVLSVERAGGIWPLFRFLAARPWLCWGAALAIYAASLTTLRNNEASVLVFVAATAISTLIMVPLTLQPHSPFGGARWLLSAPMGWLGLVSYGIYLYHYPLESWVDNRIITARLHVHDPTAGFVLLAAFGVVASIICGTLSYHLLERHVLKLKGAATFERIFGPAATAMKSGRRTAT